MRVLGLVFRGGETRGAVAGHALHVRGEKFRNVNDVVRFEHLGEILACQFHAVIRLHPGFQFLGNVQRVYEFILIGDGQGGFGFLLNISVAFAEQVEGKSAHRFVFAARRSDARHKLYRAGLRGGARSFSKHARDQQKQQNAEIEILKEIFIPLIVADAQMR